MVEARRNPHMPTEPKKPLIVISYAHADEPEHPAEGEVKWLSFVTGYLRPAIKHGAVDIWLDRLMPGGAEWEREIEGKLRACDIFILLVSRHSLSSNYVVDKEIALIRDRQGRGDAVHLYPLVLTPTPKIALDLVRDKNLRPRDGRPFSDYSINERYRHMNEAADEIAAFALTRPAHEVESEPKLERAPWGPGNPGFERLISRPSWIQAEPPKLRSLLRKPTLWEQLAERSELSPEKPLPAPMPSVDAPFKFGWNAWLRVSVVAGPSNLPFYLHVSSEEDHRRALETARVGGERLLKALRDGRYNARKEYGEALEYYLDDLPKTAGTGNILLANDQVRILHAMFLADAAMLPEGFASRLKSVIANQFALNAFYDLVQRHDEAVSAGNWSKPFPIDEAKKFFSVVENKTPRWFEPPVEEGLRQVEHAKPLVAPSEPVLASVIQPPPLPPGTPDAQDSWKRQMATAANSLWETFMRGRDMPVDKDEWRKAAEELGAHVRPIIEFLREQDNPKA
jgi:TIR domain